MTLVQGFLRSGGTLADLAQRYAIKAVRHRALPHLVTLKYSQIDSPMGEPLVRECRGIVLDESDGWACIARGFDKFFNAGEGHAATIDWSTARVQEKVDGSLCLLYCYDSVWCVATTGTPDGAGRVGADERTFAQLFWRTFADSGLELPAPGLTFALELTAPANRVVVRHDTAGLTLLGARDPRTGQEMHAADAAALLPGTVPVREFSLRSAADIAATFATMSPLAQEGYVVVDSAFRRVKVKHPGYVALHHARSGISPRAFLEIARSGEASEVLAAFPELARDFEPIRAKLDALVSELEADFARIKDAPTQKDFALLAVKSRCSGALFAVRSGKAPSMRSFLAKMPIDSLAGILRVPTDAPLAFAEAP